MRKFGVLTLLLFIEKVKAAGENAGENVTTNATPILISTNSTNASVIPTNSTLKRSSISTDELQDLPSSGTWELIPDHELAGGLVRVSGDGPKLEIAADPRTDIGWDPPVTAEMVVTHPNYRFLSTISECGFPAILDEFDTDSEEISDTTTEPVGSRQNETENQNRTKRIVGGKAVQPQRHPWMVQLYLYNVSSGEHFFHCAGTLITASTVLTAAHCLTRLAPGFTMDVVVIGNLDRRQIKFCKTSSSDEPCSRVSVREIEDFEIHDGYNEGNLDNDIGLIYLRKPIKISATARPVCLPFTSRILEYWSDLKLTGLGWGSTNKYSGPGNYLSDVLKQVQFDLQPRSLCDKFHMRIYGRMKANKICTGGNTGRASCNGDSGGAVVKALSVPDIEQGKVERVFQFGIVSAGGHPIDTCGFQGRPAIDTNVFYFLEWILNHITPGVSAYRYMKNVESPSSWVLDKPGESSGFKASELDDVGGADQLADQSEYYTNEFSTGQFIDVSMHPKISLLPSFYECGNLASAKRKPLVTKPTENPYKTNENSFIDSIGPGLEMDAIKRKKRIVGGIPLSVENFLPWMAQIYVRNVETDELGFRCSGSIISKRHILTAAHCVTELSSPFVFDSIVVGQYNRNKTVECSEDECFSPVRVKILDVIVHSDYEKYTHKNNLALVRLNEDLNFTRMVQPICLPRREAILDGIQLQRYFTVGWGRILRENAGAVDKMSGILLQMYVDVLPRRDCDFVYSRTVGLLDRSRICGGGKAGQGECLGDGGSPLMKKLELNPGHPLYNKIFQFGIVSFADCGMQGMPTVYMNVLFYMEWILDNLHTPSQT